jgi:hypothetical protein
MRPGLRVTSGWRAVAAAADGFDDQLDVSLCLVMAALQALDHIDDAVGSLTRRKDGILAGNQASIEHGLLPLVPFRTRHQCFGRILTGV